MLAYALVMMMVTSIIMVSMLQYITSQIKLGSYRLEKEKAFQVAEAGIYYYRWYLAHNVAGKTVAQIKDFWNSGTALGTEQDGVTIDYFDPEGGKIGSYKLEVIPPDPDSTIVMVKSTGWTDKESDAKRIVQARFRRPSWSENVVTANDDMRFGEGTTVNGKIISNKGIRFDGVATNVVSSALDKYDDPDHGESGAEKLEFGVHTHVNAPPGTGITSTYRPNEVPPHAVDPRLDVFQAGRQFPVAGVDFNGISSDLNVMKTAANSGHGIYFDNDGYGRKILLKTDGTFDVCTVNKWDSIAKTISNYKRNSGGGTCSSCTDSRCSTNYPIPDKGIIFVEDNVWISGQIDTKKVTIVAADLTSSGISADMFVGYDDGDSSTQDNLLYTNTNGHDIIGLIAENNISVPASSVNNLTIDAALLAKDGRIGRDSYDGNTKNSITVTGSMATNQRYGFAWVYSNGTFANGYVTRNLNFDNNLLYFPPPYFPTGTEYAIDLWQEL